MSRVERGDPSEMGRELLASDLKPGMIVFVQPPMPTPSWPQVAFTMWVIAVVPDRDLVVFFSGVQQAHVGAFITPDDSLIDDRGRKVTVFEYLGEP